MNKILLSAFCFSVKLVLLKLGIMSNLLMFMTVAEIRQAHLDFFHTRKQYEHAILPSASLLPENDPTTLFTGSGMQPMVPYLLGEKHPLGDKIVDVQKCFRAQDIEEVGDNRHTTFFEMLGNWSLGSYFKQQQIPWIFEFLVDRLKLNAEHLHVTVFRGNDELGIPRDEESAKLWADLFGKKGFSNGIQDFSEDRGIEKGMRIFYYSEKKNWWSRSGTPDKMPVGELGGPDTEMFWDFDPENRKNFHGLSPWVNEECHVNCDCGRFMEIGNNVFMEYMKTEQGFEKLKQRNVDFGGGLERIAAALNNNPDVFLTDAFRGLIKKLEELSGVLYESADVEAKGVSLSTVRHIGPVGSGPSIEEFRERAFQVSPNRHSFRIIADHIRAATFIIGDERGIGPSNVGQGYLVRRLLRRAIREGRRLGIQDAFAPEIAQIVIEIFGDHYKELQTNRERILSEIQQEEEKFGKSIEKGMRELEKMIAQSSPPDKGGKGGSVSGEQAFILFSSYGFPWELTEEILMERGLTVDRQAFEAEFKKHQALSRSASAGAFKGGLADQSAETTRLHTATHLLHRALKNVLGDHVQQKGSNITAERLRFDFSHGQKMTDEELKKVEDMVNEAIQKDLPVGCEEVSMEEAKAKGALGYFEDKYAQIVHLRQGSGGPSGNIKVYSVGDDAKGYFSKEICGGPHVSRTSELGSFKIQKEEAVSAGVRRIKATVSGPKN